MELKLGFVIVCLWALAIDHSDAGIPKCCVTTKKHIPPRVLMKVQRWDVQQSNGICDISALILHVKNWKKPVCAHPNVMEALMLIQQRRKRWSQHQSRTL